MAVRGSTCGSRARSAALAALTCQPESVTVRLPDDIAERVQGFPESSMGAKTVSVRVSDGRMFSGVVVAWDREVVRVNGHEVIPFRAEDVVDVCPDPSA